MSGVGRDEGGEAPCFAHLFDDPDEVPDAFLADAVIVATSDGTIRLRTD